MKKWLCLLLSFVLLMSFAACDSGSGGGGEKGDGNSTIESVISDIIHISCWKGTKTMIENRLPKEVWEYIKDVEDQDHEDYWKRYEEDQDNRKDALEDKYGMNYKVSFEIMDKDEIEGEDLSKIKDALNECYGINKNSVEAACEVDVEWKITGKVDEEDGDVEGYVVVQIDGRWYSYFDIIGAYMGPVEEAREE